MSALPHTKITVENEAYLPLRGLQWRAIACEIERIEDQMIRFWLYFAALACL